MRVVVPHTARHPDTIAGAPPGAEWVRVSEDRFAYWRLLCRLWADGEGFMVLEHDVVCRPDVLDQFGTCDEPWCAFPYADMCCAACVEKWRNTLGCTRFSAEIIRAVPDAVSGITPGMRDWHCLCNGLGAALRTAGFTHHWHAPPVRHHHMSLRGVRV